MAHGGMGGGGGGRGPDWPCGDPSPPGPGTPLTVLNGPILALDADLDIYAVVTYQLLGSQGGLFDIDNSTGEASVPPQHSEPGSKSFCWGGSDPLLDLGPPFSVTSRLPMETPFLTTSVPLVVKPLGKKVTVSPSLPLSPLSPLPCPCLSLSPPGWFLPCLPTVPLFLCVSRLVASGTRRGDGEVRCYH